MTRVLIVGGYELFRVGLRCLLASYSEHSLEFRDAIYQEAMQSCREFEPSIIVLDIDDPNGRGLDLAKDLLGVRCNPRIIIVTGEREPSLLNLQLESGAIGFLTKDCAVADCVNALDAAIEGTDYASPAYSRLITLGKIGGAERSQLNQLSRREMSTMLMLAQGKSHQDIAKSLNISPKTVTSYKSRIHKKLNTRNTADITRVAVRAGLLRTS